MMKKNKKGFTLVELLAVIVILAVVMLIGITSIGPLMANSRKSALRSDGLDLMNAAKTAYQAEALKTSPAFTSWFGLTNNSKPLPFNFAESVPK